jgi:hypothetical protein
MMLRSLIYLWTFPTTAVGLYVALVEAAISGSRGRVVDGVIEVHGPLTAFFLSRIVGLFLRGGASAMTLGHVVLGRDLWLLETTRAHERVHVRQCERWGPLFLPAYLGISVVLWIRRRDAYLDNPFEREAYALAD